MPLKLASIRTFVLILVSGLAAFFVLRPYHGFEQLPTVYDLDRVAKPAFSWTQISPSSTLKWTSCDLTPGIPYQCARLQVPLNYSDPEGEKAVIAMARLPAMTSPESADYRGPILFNPGGPGGSGVDLIVSAGSLLQKIVGPQFDILGFDPRGVGHSTPGFSIYESDIERFLLDVESRGAVDFNETTDSLAKAWVRAKLSGKLAQNRTSHVLPFIHTDHTARDMLQIVRAHGREKINYWGLSYGTILGGTFASMFPNNIERLVIDGVVDTENYYNGRWDDNLIDTDATLQEFFDSCHAAGPDLCAFYAPSPQEISANLTKIYDAVRAHPLPVYDETDGRYAMIDYAYLRAVIFASFYTPYASWPPLAAALADLARGDGRKALHLTTTPLPLNDLKCNTAENEFNSDVEVTAAIACNDAQGVSGDYESVKEHLKHLLTISEWGSLWERIHMMCTGWPKIEQPRFQGPIGAEETSYPILLIGNRHDPVTPWAHANRTHARFPGSALLSQNSPGHCSISAPSPCTQQYVREYFVNGTLPEPGTWCEPIRGSFTPDVSSVRSFEGDEQVQMHYEKELEYVSERALKDIRISGLFNMFV